MPILLSKKKHQAKYYYWQSVEVVFKETNFIVLKLVEEKQQEELTVNTELIGVELI